MVPTRLNTEYLNVATYLEAFWGYIWPATCHNYVPQHEEWTAPRHGGSKEFIDQVISTIGRTQIKLAIECFRSGVTHVARDQPQGRYRMTLIDLMNNHYTRGVREAMLDMILGRSDHIAKVGNVVEMFLSISFAIKDAMFYWEWSGIGERSERLDWEMYRVEHLSCVSNMEASFEGWFNNHGTFSTQRCMACQEWPRQYVCPICCNIDRNISNGSTHNVWTCFDGCITHLNLSITPKCICHFSH